MAGRALFQVDQAKPSYQGVLRHNRKCGKITDLDSHFCLRSCSYHEKGSQDRYKSLHNSTDFKRQCFRSNPIIQVFTNLDYKNDLNDKRNQPTLMDLLMGH